MVDFATQHHPRPLHPQPQKKKINIGLTGFFHVCYIVVSFIIIFDLIQTYFLNNNEMLK